jgi:hypothetical protein
MPDVLSDWGLIAEREPAEFDEPTVQELHAHADIRSRHEREAEECVARDVEEFLREELDEIRGEVLKREADAEARIRDDLETAHILELGARRFPEPGDDKLIGQYRREAERERRSLAQDRREREGPWRSTVRRPPARRARSACGGRRRPGGRRRAVSRSVGGGSSGSDSEGEPHPPGYRRSSRSLLHVGPIESRR